jgi:hypothetical protein
MIIVSIIVYLYSHTALVVRNYYPLSEYLFIFNKISFCQMNRNLVGSILGRSSIKNAHFIPIRLQTWLRQAYLVSDWLISKQSHRCFLPSFSSCGQVVSEEKFFLESTNQKKELPAAAVCNRIRMI